VIIIGVYGSNEDELVANKEFFYRTLQRVVTHFGNKRELVLNEVVNACTGHSGNSPILGHFGEEGSNDNAARLIDWCEQNSLKITNDFLQHKEIYSFTWTRKTQNLKPFSDYVIVRQDSRVKTTDVRVKREP
jgi:hypothetical protein